MIKEKGLTQKEFAAKLGMTTVGLSQIISGKPSYKTMEKIADALGVRVWELLIDEEDIREIMAYEYNTQYLTCPKCGARLRLVEDVEKEST